MNWLNLQVSVVRAPEYVGCEPVQRATWLNVLAYSAERENGGRIVGAKTWKDRQWQQTCGVTLAEVEAAAPLLTWEGDDILVWSYPTDKQVEIQAKRKAGKESGRKRHAQHQAKTPPPKPPADSSANGSASGSAPTEGEGEGEGNGMKENGMKENGIPADAFVSGSEFAKSLHAKYCELTDSKTALSYQREMAWAQFIRRGFTAEDLAMVVRWLKIKIGRGEGGFSQSSLQFGTLLLDPDRFEDKLHTARACKIPGVAPTIPALPPPNGWEAYIRKAYPGGKVSTWAVLPDDLKRECRDNLKPIAV